MKYGLKNLYANSSGRSKEAMRNIIISFIAKGVSVVCSLLIVPITINYVNPTRYGIWLTISSIIGWVLFFDFGMGHGLRNKFAEAKAKGDMELAIKFVSTTYFTLGAIVFSLLFIIGIAGQFINWPSILNVDVTYFHELKIVFAIVSFFFCINLVANLFSIILTADQKPGFAAMLGAAGQVLSLVVIYILTITSEGSLFHLALYYSGIPTIVLFVSSVYAFCFTRYKKYMPRFKYLDIKLVGSIANLGLQFFIINVCMICIFQMMNIVITRELGPDAVTEYNIAYKYFNILTIIIMIIITPFWSGYTDAYQKADYKWMENSMKKLEEIWMGSVLVSLIMLFLADSFFEIWIGKEVHVRLSTTVSLAIYVSLFNIGQIYMYLINGIGTIRIQLIIYSVFALLSWPLMVLFCRVFGLSGIVVVPAAVVLLQAVFGKIQLLKIIHSHATGIWIK